MNKILMFPLLKRDNTIEEIDENVEDTTLDDLADHYVGQIIHHMFNHNFQDNEELMKDMQFVSEFLKSAMYRNVGKYHHLQEIIDDMTDSEEIEEIEDTESAGMEVTFTMDLSEFVGGEPNNDLD